MRMMRTVLALALFATLALGIGPARAQAPDVLTVNIASYGKGIGPWCLYAAQSQGYLDQYKVKVGQWLSIIGDPLIVSALVSNQVDIAIGSSGTVVPVANGQTDQIVVIAASEGFPVSIVAPESITSMSQLAGTTIALLPNNTSVSIIGTAFIDSLVGKGKWTPLYTGGADQTHLALIGAGKVAAAMVNDPVTLDPADHLHQVIRFGGRQTYFNGPLLATKKFLQSNPEATIRFLAAFARGCNFILDIKNAAAAAGFLVKNSGVSPAAAADAYAYYVAGPYRGHSPPRDAKIDVQGFVNTVGLLKAAGSITNASFDAKSVIDTSYLDKALKLPGVR